MRVTNSWEHPTRSTPQITRITPTHPRSSPSGQESIQKRKGSRLNLGQIERGRDEAYLIEVVGGGRHGEGELRRRERHRRQGRRTRWSCEERRRQERRDRGSLRRRGRLRTAAREFGSLTACLFLALVLRRMRRFGEGGRRSS